MIKLTGWLWGVHCGWDSFLLKRVIMKAQMIDSSGGLTVLSDTQLHFGYCVSY